MIEIKIKENRKIKKSNREEKKIKELSKRRRKWAGKCRRRMERECGERWGLNIRGGF